MTAFDKKPNLVRDDDNRHGYGCCAHGVGLAIECPTCPAHCRTLPSGSECGGEGVRIREPLRDTTTNCAACDYCGDEGAAYCHEGRFYCQPFHASMAEARDRERARIRRIVEGLPKYGSRSALTVNVDDLLAAIDGGDDA